MININNIKNNDEFIFNISKKDYNKLTSTIQLLNDKYSNSILKLYKIEDDDTQNFNFEYYKNTVNLEKNLIKSIILDVLEAYKNELSNLSCVFLSGSFARGTNKMSSDLDLHFFYNNGEYNFVYEEIVCYIISRLIKKSRDCIDPTFILNLSLENKEFITSQMTDKKLCIKLIQKTNIIKYSYSSAKKRRFFLQYNNFRDIKFLQKYLILELHKHNYEWVHCFDVLYGDKLFKKVYNQVYKEEKKLINKKYIVSKINDLKQKINKTFSNSKLYKISEIKNQFQNLIFDIIYEYISIIRLILINGKEDLQFFNLFDIYNYYNSPIIIDIYEYMWTLRKLTVFCHNNNINYGLHNNDEINYDISELYYKSEKLKEEIIKDLNRMENTI